MMFLLLTPNRCKVKVKESISFKAIHKQISTLVATTKKMKFRILIFTLKGLLKAATTKSTKIKVESQGILNRIGSTSLSQLKLSTKLTNHTSQIICQTSYNSTKTASMGADRFFSTKSKPYHRWSKVDWLQGPSVGLMTMHLKKCSFCHSIVEGRNTLRRRVTLWAWKIFLIWALEADITLRKIPWWFRQIGLWTHLQDQVSKWELGLQTIWKKWFTTNLWARVD